MQQRIVINEAFYLPFQLFVITGIIISKYKEFHIHSKKYFLK